MEPDYLDDPEHEKETWNEPIQASNPDQAEDICTELAQEYGVELTGVNYTGGQDGFDYDCIFEG